jgi:hypothetical protein
MKFNIGLVLVALAELSMIGYNMAEMIKAFNNIGNGFGSFGYLDNPPRELEDKPIVPCVTWTDGPNGDVECLKQGCTAAGCGCNTDLGYVCRNVSSVKELNEGFLKPGTTLAGTSLCFNTKRECANPPVCLALGFWASYKEGFAETECGEVNDDELTTDGTDSLDRPMQSACTAPEAKGNAYVGVVVMFSIAALLVIAGIVCTVSAKPVITAGLSAGVALCQLIVMIIGAASGMHDYVSDINEADCLSQNASLHLFQLQGFTETLIAVAGLSMAVAIANAVAEFFTKDDV